jgi:membrane peptidoglycan carboxypeptidase
LTALGAILGSAALAYAVQKATIPTPSEMSRAQAAVFYYDDGVTELGRLGEANRVSVPLADVPLDVQRAVLAAEDRTFYEHGGFSPRGIARALWNNLKSSSTQGGSTITQQYAKNAYLSDERRIQRKVKELVLAIKLETVASKDQILENYLNTIFFGRGAYGIETAANAYFNKDVANLSVSQAAVLAAIIQAPNGLSPESHLEALTARWNYVLDGMVQQGWLPADERAGLAFPDIVPFQPGQVFGGTKGYLLEQARQSVYALGISEDELNRAGFSVVTTFNKPMQDAAVAAVEQEGPTTGTKGLRIGLAAVRPGTGEVVAIYGGKDYLVNQVNNATQAIGQGGSTFKPFTLAAALENNISLATTFSGKNKTKVDNYVVVNYGDRSFGSKITLLKATENSVNSAYVQCAKQVGLETVMKSAIRAGIPQDAVGMEPNLAFTLGTASPRVVDIAGAYSTFAARGLQVNPVYIKQIKTASGDQVYTYQPQPIQAFSTDVADIVNYALQKVVTDGTGKAAKALGRPAAGKTGTTNDNKSALFAGYTQELAAAIMFTKDGPDGKPITLSGTGGMDTVTGGSFPARIWTAFMKAALADIPTSEFAPLPAGVPNGAKPTDSPSPSPMPSPTGSGTSSPTPTPEPTPAKVPDVSSAAFVAATGGSFAEVVKMATIAGFNIAYDTTVANLDVSNAWVVVDSQDLIAGSDGYVGDTITVMLTDRRPS